MNDQERRRLESLKKAYQYSQLVCDPIDFLNRKRILLHKVVETLLEPLYDEEINKSTQLPEEESLTSSD